MEVQQIALEASALRPRRAIRLRLHEEMEDASMRETTTQIS